jgi:hypothetical protein
MQVRLVGNLSRDDRPSVCGTHLHPFEGHSESLAELSAHHYPVGVASMDPLFATALHMTLSIIGSARACGHHPRICFTRVIYATCVQRELDKSSLAGPLERLLARGDSELAVDRLNVGLYRVDRDVETLRNLSERTFAVEKTQHG